MQRTLCDLLGCNEYDKVRKGTCIFNGVCKDLHSEGGRSFLQIFDDWRAQILQPERGIRPTDLLKVPILLQEMAWEKLHTGNWKDVALAWREGYTLACVLTATARLQVAEVADNVRPELPILHSASSADHGIQAGPGKGDKPSIAAAITSSTALLGQTQAVDKGRAEAKKAALRDLDLAVMMGGPHLQKFAHKMIKEVMRENAEPVRDTSQLADQSTGPQTSSEDRPAKKQRIQPSENANDIWSQRGLPPGSGQTPGEKLNAEPAPSLEGFWTSFMHPEVPAVISGAIDHWPALARWKDLKYLSQLAGARTVPVEVGEHYLQDGWGQRLMLFSDFIASLADPAKQADKTTRSYLAQHPLFDQIPDLKADICEPEYCCLGEGEMQAVNAWLGPEGTVTPLHFDPHHNLLAQVVGSKYVRLYSPECTDQLEPHESGHNTNSSQIDLDSPDAQHRPRLRALAFKECILEPGQMLYIPPKHWHFVKALELSFSVSFWWQ